MGWLGSLFVCGPVIADGIARLGVNNVTWLGVSFVGSSDGTDNVVWLGVSLIVYPNSADDVN